MLNVARRKDSELGVTLIRQKKYNEAEEVLRQAVHRQERTFVQDHADTLSSKSLLGVALHKQKKYGEAEEVLRHAVHGQERALGQDHADTFSSKYWLGVTLYKQKKYNEAEEVLRQAVHGQERTLGQDHVGMLSSKHWLGRALQDQKKYGEAEEVLRHAVHGQERALGQDHADTLSSKYWLGVTLYKQKKYNEAEEVLRQALYGQESAVGQDHADTLSSKSLLGVALHKQKKYGEAEEVLRHAVYEQERALGQDHAGTLSSKHWLGVTLHNRKKYGEAKEVLQQVVRREERILGQDHAHTLSSKYWLGRTLNDQKKYAEAEEVPRQAMHRQERTLGKDHKGTLATVRLLQGLHLKSPSVLPTNATTQHTLAGRLNSFFANGRDHQRLYTDSEICEISTLLKHSNPQWSKVPRTYIVLRTIGYLNFLDNLIDVGFSDYWFPVTERTLPGCLQPSVRAAFVRAQSLVLTKSIDLERGQNGQHCHFEQEELVPFNPKGILGSGGFGQVDKVVSQISFKEYARKRVPRSFAFRGRQKEAVMQFIAEIEILKRLKHLHIVEFVGSYTDPKYVGLIMSPITEMNLADYLVHASASNHRELRTFFGCLARALEFLHEQKIRHKDIKPSNILVHHGTVLFTDFGLSFDFTDATGSTTMSMVNGMTPKYCAPEVALHEPRNTMSDIWSLGVVFMEMIVVLKGKTIQYMDEFFGQHGSRQVFIRTNLTALSEFIVELEGIGELSDNGALGWTQQMLSAEQRSRPTTSSLVASITAFSKEGEGMGFCGICCVSSEEFPDKGDD
ncbi:kinase-like protein [Zopfia rhizophila CBS 207.26]|uniref:Kinase-like protein n=2 Tax=Zopfia rhizophila CBS 207.26 TaxID=1314779 RepID=A0A6A6DAF6_9PEZI|nr:kinase-like protein [Zopfia rhizophila CBS 207.26]